VRPGSGDDARWVLAQAERLGVPARAVRLPEGPDDEARLREGRRAAWAPVIDAGGVVATGHHRRDQAETVLLQLLRGGGGAARQGMRWSHGGVVRPLLDTSEEALTAYAEARGLSWRDDPSNREPRYLRNRVRHELLPLLEALRPGAVGALARSAALAADDEALLEQLAGDALHTWRRGDGLEAHWVATGPASLVRRALRSLWPSLDGAKLDAVRALARGRGGPVSLDADRQLVAVDGVLRLRG
jgi:tRNA(Ile)-lysidine synthase